MPTYFTGKGDDGTTGLLGQGRVAKFDLRLETLGAVDETTAQIGLARVLCVEAQSKEILLQVQRHLYDLMGEVAATPENAKRFQTIHSEHVIWLEDKIGQISQWVQLPGEFIIPGDTQVGAQLDVARTVVRRAERRVAELMASEKIQNPELLRYMNRLSSLMFLLELFENQSAGKRKPTLAKGG